MNISQLLGRIQQPGVRPPRQPGEHVHHAAPGAPADDASRQGIEARSIILASALTGVAAVAGNAFVGKAAMDWYRSLAAPRWQLPLPAFIAVGAVYYGIIGHVLARSIDRRDAMSTVCSLAVLVGNEAWNGAFFGRRSTRAGFVGLCAFVVPVLALQRSVAGDTRSRYALAPYTAHVVLYDLPWIYRLWRLNPAPGRTRP